LQRGEPIIHNTLAGTPSRTTHVLRTQLPDADPVRVGNCEKHACEVAVRAADTLEVTGTDGQSELQNPPPQATTRRTPDPQQQRLIEDV
jgi:hypothetical protein